MFGIIWNYFQQRIDTANFQLDKEPLKGVGKYFGKPWNIFSFAETASCTRKVLSYTFQMVQKMAEFSEWNVDNGSNTNLK